MQLLDIFVCFPVRIFRHLKNRHAERVNKDLRNIFSKFSSWTAAKERGYKKLPYKHKAKHTRDTMSSLSKYHITLLNGLGCCVRKNFVFLAIFSWQILAQRFPCVFRGFSQKTPFYFKVTVWRILQYLVIKRIDMSKLGCLSNSDRNNISIKGVNLMKKTYHLVNTVVFSDCTVIESDGGTN